MLDFQSGIIIRIVQTRRSVGKCAVQNTRAANAEGWMGFQDSKSFTENKSTSNDLGSRVEMLCPTTKLFQLLPEHSTAAACCQ